MKHTRTSNVIAYALALAAIFPAATGVGLAQQGQANRAGQPQNPVAGEVHVFPVRGNVYVVTGAGGNITLQTGKGGILLVDSGLAAMSDKVVAAIRTVSKEPIRFIVNTHVHADHTGGNENIAKLGSTITDVNAFSDIAGPSEVPGAKIIAHEAVLDRMTAGGNGQPSAPSGAWPATTYITKRKDLFINNEAVVLFHAPAAHTDGDSIVFFRRSDVISSGDLFTPDTYPFIDLPRGGNIQGILAALNHIIELAVPDEREEGGTYIIPGHGRVCDEADVVEYQTMLTIIRDRIQDLVKKGMTLEQVKAAKPTFDYDAHYGSTSGFWTTEMFIEAVYRNLTKK